MTLKEKFQQWFINDEEDEHYEGMVELVSIEHEKVAEEFAISFAEWFINSWCLHSLSYRDITIKQSLEIFKKEKGL
jgi:hypothetical protein